MILLMGIAGSGKGTQGKLLGSILKRKVISTGELLRNYGSDDQHDRMHRGEILRDDEVTALLNTALNELQNPDDTILDGYPRTLEQAKWLLQDDRFKLQYVVHLEASRDAVKARLKGRARSDDNEDAIEARFNEYESLTLPILEFFKSQEIPVIIVNGEQPIEDVHQELLSLDYTQRKQA